MTRESAPVGAAGRTLGPARRSGPGEYRGENG